MVWDGFASWLYPYCSHPEFKNYPASVLIPPKTLLAYTKEHSLQATCKLRQSLSQKEMVSNQFPVYRLSGQVAPDR